MISINCLVLVAFAIILLTWEYLSFVRARARARVCCPPLKCIELKYIALIDDLY